MKIFRFYPPYKLIGKDRGKTTFPDSRQRSGVYIIKEDHKIVYVGYSGTDLYKTMYRHFQEWNDSRLERVTYYKQMKKGFKSYTVRIVYCTPAQADNLEKALIMKYSPRDNTNSLFDGNVSDKILSVYTAFEDAPIEREAPF